MEEKMSLSVVDEEAKSKTNANPPEYQYKVDYAALPIKSNPPPYEADPPSKKSSCGACTYFLVVFRIFSVLAVLVIGVKYIDDCPAQEYIPIWLIVTGVVWFIETGINTFQDATGVNEKSSNNGGKRNSMTFVLDCLLCLVFVFNFGLFIAGNIWVWETVGKINIEDNNAINYCHPTLYGAALSVITALFIILGIQTLVCFCGCYKGCREGCKQIPDDEKESNDQENNAEKTDEFSP